MQVQQRTNLPAQNQTIPRHKNGVDHQDEDNCGLGLVVGIWVVSTPNNNKQ
jgi:hypothetical protein